jgi:beta-1,4-mannosyltransferase
MSIKIASNPGSGNVYNPYVDMFYHALKPYGVELTSEFDIDILWLVRNKEHLDAIHFHWPEVFWKKKKLFWDFNFFKFLLKKIPGVWRLAYFFKDTRWLSFGQLWDLVRFIFFIKISKKLGLHIIWTFHNSESHEGNNCLDIIGSKFLARNSDLLIFHSNISRIAFIEKYGQVRGEGIVMPHGNYDGIYPVARSRDVILNEIGFRGDLPIVSCLGMLRDYKGLDIATEVISLISENVQFLCAGWPHPAFDESKLRVNINKVPNALLISRFLTDQEFSDYVAISDIILMPYRQITGSGALLAVLTLGRPVIASKLPYFSEILEGRTNAGVLVSLDDVRLIADTIIQFLQIPQTERNSAAKLLADKYSWEKVIVPVAKKILTWK